MTILMVDDDAHVVQSIRNHIDWTALGITQVLTAYNVRQAQSTLSVYPVDLMLCDIEMPQGSGLDLLEWVRDKGMELEAIFLTSYSNFDYARRAIALESLEYYLKPINYEVLAEGLRRAVGKARQRLEAERYRQQSAYWENSHDNLIRHFWQMVLSGKMAGDPVAVAQQIDNDQLPYTPESLFIPVLFRVIDRKGDINNWGEDTFDYGVVNVMEEVFTDSGLSPEVMHHLGDERWVVVLPLPNENRFLDIEAATDRVIGIFNTHFKLDVFCGVGYMNVLSGLHDNINTLETMLTNNVHQVNQSLQLSMYEHQELAYEPPPISQWEEYLERRNDDGLLNSVAEYLQKTQTVANAENMKRFRLDITQLVYSFLRKREIRANELFYNEKSERLYKYSVVSIDDMRAYTRHLVDSAAGYAQYVQHPGGVVEKLLEYIDNNYQHEISREAIAKTVFLNQDYVSRLFKKETGKSISTYVTERRMAKAKELLRETDMPVYLVSTCVGYDNFAYFSKLFKKSNGTSPNEYRKGSVRHLADRNG